MPSFAKAIPTSLAVIAAYAQWVNALGCYSGGLGFNNLHGGDNNNDLTEEVKNDIHTTCTKAAGKVIKPSEPFWLCTNWERNQSPNPDCFSNCIDGCNALDENVRWGCLLGCDSNCGAIEGGFNHIDWAIEVRDGQAEKTITYEQCSEAFNTELGGCHAGSEQNHFDFWFRIDPNRDACP
ncbi:hypothetical protein FNYG_14774 [Fusarium nygamai]|uniref:Uncharacterized protein n=1 Tax=Gibberella nygamai TaxID=42673 RepID=A0A2K0UQ42_GIBNY|nr:hypothetical protein FNYG_14774 [Fusarium nygamai]